MYVDGTFFIYQKEFLFEFSRNEISFFRNEKRDDL